MISYLEFRSNALSSVAMVRGTKQDIFPKHWSKDDYENWIKKEYERHYTKELELVS